MNPYEYGNGIQLLMPRKKPRQVFYVRYYRQKSIKCLQ